MTWKDSKEEPMKTCGSCTKQAESTAILGQKKIGMGRSCLASRRLTN